MNGAVCDRTKIGIIRLAVLKMNYQESDRKGDAGSPSLLIKFGSAI